MSNDLHLQLQALFRDVFDDDDLQFTDELSRESLKGWDSLGHIRLITAIEEALALSFTLDEIEAMTSVPQILAVLAAKS